MKLFGLFALIALVDACPSARPCVRDDQCEDGQFCNLSRASVGACQQREGSIGEGEGSPGEGEGSPGEGEGEGAALHDTATALGVGVGFGCAIDSHQRVQCWGGGLDGQLGRDVDTNTGSPAEVVAGITNAELIAVAQRHTCVVGVVDGARTIACFGDNTNAALGTANNVVAGELAIPNMPGVHDVDELSAGGNSINGDAVTCAHITEGQTYCFGPGVTGFNTTLAQAVHIAALDDVTAVFASPHALCGMTASNDVVCENTDSFVASTLGCSDGTPCADLKSGDFSIDDDTICFRDALSDHEVLCEGDNTYGVVNPSGPGVPNATTELFPGNHVQTGTQHACAVDSISNHVRCWGRDLFFSTGQPLGASLNDCNDAANDPNNETFCQVPIEVPMPPGLSLFTSVAVNDTGACALEDSGRVACWGDLMTIGDQTGEAAIEIPLAP